MKVDYALPPTPAPIVFKIPENCQDLGEINFLQGEQLQLWEWWHEKVIKIIYGDKKIPPN